MSIGIVTVTYGNRFHYLEQLISYVQKNDQVHKAVIVTNGIEQTVLNQINSAVAGSEKFIIFSFENNEGSAAGFKKGIEIMRQESDYIWLLDDDNLPEPQALSSLTTHWKVLKMRDNKDALLSYRPDRSFYRSVQLKNPRGMIGMDNSFMGFHVLDKISKLFKQKSIDPNISYGPVIVATFGGMFFHKDLLLTIGLPKEILFLYGDDYDFSYRITQQKGKIILVKESEVQDLEKSFHLNRKKKIQTRFSSTEFEKGIYYMTRNNILFEQNFVNNRLLYQFNKWIYLMLLIPILVVNNEFYKLSYIMKGIRDAELMIKEED